MEMEAEGLVELEKLVGGTSSMGEVLTIWDQ